MLANTVMAAIKGMSMARSRAMLTEREREQIAGEYGADRKYQATSRARRRIKEELTTDIRLLEEHQPDLLAEIRDVVCVSRETNE